MKTLIQPKRYVPKVGDAIIYSRKRLMVIWDQATRFSVIEKSTMLVLEELIFDLVEDEDGCVRLANPDQLWGGNGYHDNVFMDDAYTEHMNQIVATVENKEYQLTEIKDSQESGMPPKPSFWKDLFGRRSKKQKRLVSTLFQNQQPEGSFIVYVNEYSFTTWLPPYQQLAVYDSDSYKYISDLFPAAAYGTSFEIATDCAEDAWTYMREEAFEPHPYLHPLYRYFFFWNGTGDQPPWVQNYLGAGGSIEDLRVPYAGTDYVEHSSDETVISNENILIVFRSVRTQWFIVDKSTNKIIYLNLDYVGSKGDAKIEADQYLANKTL